jgi:LPS-assembly lipoprotein
MKVFKLLALGCLAVLPVSMTACGFAPMYAQTGLTANLSQVAVETPQTRTGYFLGQQLRNGLASDTNKTPLYTLTIALDERHYQVGYRVDDTSTRSELTSSVVYTLTDNRTRQAVLKDSFTETVTYSTSSSPFTGIVSQQDAQERLATSAAQKIQTAIALHFHGK